ncbi:hypothetical protein H0H93_013787 [Arthromyces matolae]|nr:hypothetical protein H0H93_013787 [Arthromyces matolae]
MSSADIQPIDLHDDETSTVLEDNAASEKAVAADKQPNAKFSGDIPPGFPRDETPRDKDIEKAIKKLQANIYRFQAGPNPWDPGYVLHPLAGANVYKLYINKLETQVNYDQATGKTEVIALFHLPFGPSATLRVTEGNLHKAPVFVNVNYPPLITGTSKGDASVIVTKKEDGRLYVNFNFAIDGIPYTGERFYQSI